MDYSTYEKTMRTLSGDYKKEYRRSYIHFLKIELKLALEDIDRIQEAIDTLERQTD